MKTWRALFKNFLIASLSLLSFSGPALALSNITILADESVSLVASKLARDYARQNGVAVTTSFIGKHAQAEQINEGGEANILITPDVAWLDELQASGLIDISSRTGFAASKLALVGNAASNLQQDFRPNSQTAAMIQAMQFEQAFLVGSPESIYTGRYAREALRNMGWMDALEPYILFIKDPVEMHEMVAHDALAIMPYPEALLLNGTKIIGTFPENTHSPVMYYAVVIAGDQMSDARQFISYLRSTTAQTILGNAGLIPQAASAANAPSVRKQDR